MSTDGLLLVALIMAVGLVGVLVPLVPGLPLVWLGGLVWALGEDGGAARWIVLAAMSGLLLAGSVAKYVLPGRSLRATGASRLTLLAGAAGAVAGFFVLPVLGLLVGGVLGVFLAERSRLGSTARAAASTRAVLVQVGIGMALELGAGLAMVLVWLAGVAVS